LQTFFLQIEQKEDEAAGGDSPDFSQDSVLLAYINPKRFLIVDYMGYRIFRINW
jgi:hypothetical protein